LSLIDHSPKWTIPAEAGNETYNKQASFGGHGTLEIRKFITVSEENGI